MVLFFYNTVWLISKFLKIKMRETLLHELDSAMLE